MSSPEPTNGKSQERIPVHVATKQGLHLRPAGIIGAYVQKLSAQARVYISHAATQERADGASPLSVMALFAECGTACVIDIEAENAEICAQIRKALLSLRYHENGQECPIFVSAEGSHIADA